MGREEASNPRPGPVLDETFCPPRHIPNMIPCPLRSCLYVRHRTGDFVCCPNPPACLKTVFWKDCETLTQEAVRADKPPSSELVQLYDSDQAPKPCCHDSRQRRISWSLEPTFCLIVGSRVLTPRDPLSRVLTRDIAMPSDDSAFCGLLVCRDPVYLG